MSSALSTLKKNRRAPLIPGETHRERQFYKEGAHTGRPPSDFELMSSMVQRLGQLERRVKAQELDINGKARRIAALEEKLQLLQEKTRGGKQDEEGLAEKCRRLQNQVQEMEKFLNDYGLIWVGDAKDPEAAEKSDSGRTIWQPDVSQLRNFSMNFDLVLQSVKDLNILAGEGESFVRSVPGGAKLIQQEAIPLCLYKNGIVMFQGPFRSYQDPSTQRCMRDLMDGYFPSELQKRFPDGVVFQVTDRREEEFRVRRTTVFSGRGQTVGGSEEEVQDHREEDTSTHTLLNHSQSQSTGQRLSMEQFLNKLPQSVVRGGKVINIRSSLKALLQGCAEAGSDSVAVIETPALHALRERPESSEDERSEAEVTTLRVKSEDGEKTFILKMFFSDTIAHLRHHLDTHRGPSSPSYDIISAFPQRCHSDDTQSMLACGLTPNAALLLRPRPPLTSPANHF